MEIVSLDRAVQMGFFRFVCTGVEALPEHLVEKVRDLYGPTFGDVFVQSTKISAAHAPGPDIRYALWSVYAEIAGDRLCWHLNDGFREKPFIRSFTRFAEDLHEAWAAVVAGLKTIEEVEAPILAELDRNEALGVESLGVNEVLVIPPMSEMVVVINDLAARINAARDAGDQATVEGLVADQLLLSFLGGNRDQILGAIREWPRLKAEAMQNSKG